MGKWPAVLLSLSFMLPMQGSLLFLADRKVSHHSPGKVFTNRQTEGTRQLHYLNGLGRAARCFCTVHKLIQQFISVKEKQNVNIPHLNSWTPSKIYMQNKI